MSRGRQSAVGALKGTAKQPGRGRGLGMKGRLLRGGGVPAELQGGEACGFQREGGEGGTSSAGEMARTRYRGL